MFASLGKKQNGIVFQVRNDGRGDRELSSADKGLARETSVTLEVVSHYTGSGDVSSGCFAAAKRVLPRLSAAQRRLDLARMRAYIVAAMMVLAS